MANIDRGPLPQDNFAMISNDWLRDKRLSWKARGLLAWLASHKVGFQVSLSRIVAASDRDGREAARAAIKELEVCGYLVRSKDRDDAGRITSASYTLVDACPDCSEDPNAQVTPMVGFPDVGKTDDGSPDVGSADVGSPDGSETRPHKKTNSSKKTNEEKTELSLVPPPAAEKPTRSKSRRKTTVPDGWDPLANPELRDWAKSSGAPSPQWARTETQRFLDWTLANGRTYADWNAAWRNWIGKAVNDLQNQPRTRRPVSGGFYGQGMFS